MDATHTHLLNQLDLLTHPVGLQLPDGFVLLPASLVLFRHPGRSNTRLTRQTGIKGQVARQLHRHSLWSRQEHHLWVYAGGFGKQRSCGAALATGEAAHCSIVFSSSYCENLLSMQCLDMCSPFHTTQLHNSICPQRVHGSVGPVTEVPPCPPPSHQ